MKHKIVYFILFMLISISTIAKENNVLRVGDVGTMDELIVKRNPDKLYLIYTTNVNILIKEEEIKKGRKLSADEIQKIRSTATVKAVKEIPKH